MTDKEMADEWVKANCDDSLYSFRGQELQGAYIAGLKAGRPKWHDLRKDPDDLPPNEHEVYVAAINETARGKEFVYGFDRYLTNDKCWFVDSALEPIAWCEIPKYTEE